MSPGWLIVFVVLVPFVVMALLLGFGAMGDRAYRDERYRIRGFVLAGTGQALAAGVLAILEYRDGNLGLYFWVLVLVFLLAPVAIIYEVRRSREGAAHPWRPHP